MFKETLEKLSLQNKDFALLRIPETNEIQLWTNDDLESKNKFLFHSFDNQKEFKLQSSKVLTLNVEDFSKFDFSSLNLNFNKINEKHSALSKEKYFELLNKTIHNLNNSSTKKIVISRAKKVDYKTIHIFKSFLNLVNQHSKALVYLYHNPQKATWIGATPELLLEKIGNEIKTVSLAGTKTPENQWTSKEYKEQQVVTDFILNSLQGVNHIEVDGPHTSSAGNIEHLKTYISGKLNDDNQLEKILHELHPTPAVCGLPKKEAFDFIIKNEAYSREFYAGFIGIETPQKKDYFVNLRCAQIFSDAALIYVGGGIMPDSNPESEWKETELKSKTILNSLVFD